MLIFLGGKSTRNHNNAENEDGTVKRGDRVQFYWRQDLKYYSGTVRHLHKNCETTVVYDDGGKKIKYGK